MKARWKWIVLVCLGVPVSADARIWAAKIERDPTERLSQRVTRQVSSPRNLPPTRLPKRLELTAAIPTWRAVAVYYPAARNSLLKALKGNKRVVVSWAACRA